MLKSLAKPLIGIAITVFFLVLVISNLKFDKVGAAFSQANYLYLLPAVAITFTDYLIRAWRWQFILEPTKRISFKSSYSILMIGFMANNLLPARIGEFVRAYTLSNEEEVSKSLSLATIVLERVCDGLTLIALMGVALVAFPSPHQTAQTEIIEIVSTAVFLGAIIFLVFLMLRERWVLRFVSFCLKPLPKGLEHKAHNILTSFVLGLHALKKGRIVLAMALISLLIWTMEGCTYYLMLRAFQIDSRMSALELVGAGLLLLVFVNLGTMIPSAPGYVGVYQAAAAVALGAYAVSNETAFSLAILTNTYQYVLVTGIGLFFFSRRHMSFKALRASKQAGDIEQERETEQASHALGLDEAETPAFSPADS